MSRPMIHLFAEQDHDTKNKECTELVLLAKLKKKNKVLGLSFEINRKCQRLLDGLGAHKKAADFSIFGDKTPLLKWAIKNKVPLLASDNWAEDAMMGEVGLECEIDRLEEKKRTMLPNTEQFQHVENQQEKLIKKLRKVEKQSMFLRDTYAARRLDSFLWKKCPKKKKGVLVHVCGLGHLPGLKKRLEEMGHAVEVTVILDDANYLRLSRSNIHTVTGSLLDANVEMIVHGVAQNRRDQMGKGIAKEIKALWPGSFLRFAAYRDSHRFDAGDAWIDKNNWMMIAYVATQPDLRRAELKYIDAGMKDLRKKIEKEGISSVGLPRIGCGYGRLKWNDVRPIIEKHLSGLDALIILYEKNGAI